MAEEFVELHPDRNAVANAVQGDDIMQAVFEGVDAGLLVVEGGTGRILQANRRAEAMLNTPGKDLVGSGLPGLVAGADGAETHAIVRAMARGAAHAEDVQLQLAGGQSLWVRLEASPLPERAGLTVLLLRDINQRKASEARLALALEAGALGTWELDLRTGVFERSAMHDHIFGYATPHQEWSFARLLQHVLGADRKTVENSLREALTARSAWHFRCRIRRGQDRALRWIEVRGAPEGAGPDGVALRLVGVVADVTERAAVETSLRRAKRTLEQQVAERAARLAESEVRLRTVFEHTAEALFLIAVASDGRFVFQGLNPALERATGLSSEALRGRAPADVLPPDVAASVEANYRRCVETRAPIRYEERLSLPGGTREWETVLAPVFDPESGHVTLLVGSARDVTERRHLETRLAQAERMEALGQLAGGVAHDMNNVLQAVLGGAKLIAKRPSDPATVSRLTGMIVEAAERGASVTRRLLSFARRGELRAAPVDTEELLADLGEVLAHTLGAEISVRVSAEKGLPPIMADRGQLVTVLLNLATNARDAMPGGGALGISAVTLTVRDDPDPMGLAPGSYVRLSIADTGHGMDATTLARAAEPFFTTKPKGRGTGLGLSMAKGFAEQSGGTILVESVPLHGTTVSLWIPCATELALSAEAGRKRVDAPALSDATQGGGLRVMLVDDEPYVLTVLSEGLSARGYHVTPASDPRDALAHLDGGCLVDLLVTDLAMPEMDGLALISAVRSRRPELPALLVTGHAGEAAAAALEQAAGTGPFALLRKPLSPDELADRVGALFAGFPASLQ